MHRTEPTTDAFLARALRPVRGLLFANAVLLAAVAASFWMRGAGPFGPAGASAQDADVYSNEGVNNIPPRQRQSMIDLLRSIDARRGAMEKRLSAAPLPVRVILPDEDR